MSFDTTSRSYYSSSSLGRRTMPSSHRFRPISSTTSSLHGRYSKPDLSTSTIFDVGSSPSLSLYLPPKTGSPSPCSSPFQSSRCSSSSQYYTTDRVAPMSPAMSRRDNIIRTLVRTSNDLSKHHFLSTESISMMTRSHDVHAQSTRAHFPVNSINKTTSRSTAINAPMTSTKVILSGSTRSLPKREISIPSVYRPVVIERPSLTNYQPRPREDRQRLQFRPITRDRPLIKFLERDDLDPSKVRSLLNSWAKGEPLDDEFFDDPGSHKRDSVRSNDSGIGSFRGSRRSRQKSGEASNDNFISNYANKENEIPHSIDQKSSLDNDRAPSVDEGVHLDNEETTPNLSAFLNELDNTVLMGDKKSPQTNEIPCCDEASMTKRRVRINSDKYVLPSEKTISNDGKTEETCSTNSGLKLISIEKRVRAIKKDQMSSSSPLSENIDEKAREQNSSSSLYENFSGEDLSCKKKEAPACDSKFSQEARSQTYSDRKPSSHSDEKALKEILKDENIARDIECSNGESVGIEKKNEIVCEQLSILQALPSLIPNDTFKGDTVETRDYLNQDSKKNHVFNKQLHEANVMPQHLVTEPVDLIEIPVDVHVKEEKTGNNSHKNNFENKVEIAPKIDAGKSIIESDVKILPTGTKPKVKKKKITTKKKELVSSQCVEKQAEGTKTESVLMETIPVQSIQTSAQEKNSNVIQQVIQDKTIILDLKNITQHKKILINDQNDQNLTSKNNSELEIPSVEMLPISQRDSNFTHQDNSSSKSMVTSKREPIADSNVNTNNVLAFDELVDENFRNTKFNKAVIKEASLITCKETIEKKNGKISSIQKSRSSDLSGLPKQSLDTMKVKRSSFSGTSNLNIGETQTSKPEKILDESRKNCLKSISDEKIKNTIHTYEGNELRRSTTTSLTTACPEEYHKIQKSSTLGDVGSSPKCTGSRTRKPPLPFSSAQKITKYKTRETITLDLSNKLNSQKTNKIDSLVLTSHVSSEVDKIAIVADIKFDSNQKENICMEDEKSNSVVGGLENARHQNSESADLPIKVSIFKASNKTTSESHDISKSKSMDSVDLTKKSNQVKKNFSLPNEQSGVKKDNDLQIYRAKKRYDNNPEDDTRNLLEDSTKLVNNREKLENLKTKVISEKSTKSSFPSHATETLASRKEQIIKVEEKTELKKMDEDNFNICLTDSCKSEPDAKVPLSKLEKSQKICAEKTDKSSTSAIDGTKEIKTILGNKSANINTVETLPQKELVRTKLLSDKTDSILNADLKTKEKINKKKATPEIFQSTVKVDKEIADKKTNSCQVVPECSAKLTKDKVDPRRNIIPNKTIQDTQCQTATTNEIPASGMEKVNVDKIKKTVDEQKLKKTKNTEAIKIENSKKTEHREDMKQLEEKDCKIINDPVEKRRHINNYNSVEKNISAIEPIENIKSNNQILKEIESPLNRNLQILDRENEKSDTLRVSKETTYDDCKSSLTQFTSDDVSRSLRSKALIDENKCLLSTNEIGIKTERTVEKHESEIDVNRNVIKSSLGGGSKLDTPEVKSDVSAPSETKIKKKKSLSGVECEKIKKKKKPLTEAETDKVKKKKRKKEKDANEQHGDSILPIKKETTPSTIDNIGVSKLEDSSTISTKTDDVNGNVFKQSLDDLWEDYQNSASNLQQSIVCCSLDKSSKHYSIEDFHLLKVLGRGSYGKVMLAELKGKKQYFAIKCLKKDVVQEDNDVECTLIEKEVLAMGSSHPYLCTLFCTFQSESYLFFVMEYLSGGDLMFHIQQCGRFNQDRARFYAAEIICALKYLHAHGIIYRDAKLDNICIDSDGHVRLVDFGFCKLRIYRKECLPRNLCGTPDYMAPEILKGYHYNHSVDWWSFGVLLYEMLVGYSPFHGADEEELFWAICNEDVIYPRFLSKEAMHILVLLLNRDPEKRLGMPGCVAGDVYCQPFFRPIDWLKAERKQLEPPFKPKLNSETDVSNFDSDFTMERAALTPTTKEVVNSIDQEAFFGFTYINPLMLMD